MNSKTQMIIAAAAVMLSTQGGKPILPESSYHQPLPSSSFSKRKKRQRKARR